MRAKQLYELIITPTLKELNLYSENAAKLLLLTAAQESNVGKYIKQVKGIALGIYQCEPETHEDIVVNFLNYHSELRRLVAKVALIPIYLIGYDELLLSNLRYSTCICRLHYLRQPSKLPKDVSGMADYWKQHYNTPLGKGTAKSFSNKAARIMAEIE